MSSVPSLLRAARRQAGLTQAQLADRCGMTQPEIARMERADANPTLATLEQVVRATGHRVVLESTRLPGVDETQLRERLRLSPAERLAAFQGSKRKLDRLVAGAQRVGSPAR